MEFLHAEFKPAMKTIQIPKISVKNEKNRKMNYFGTIW